MLYRETGVFHGTYGEDQAVFKLPLDRYAVWIVVAVALFVVPLVASNYVLTDLFTPFLIMSIAALGLNVLTAIAASSRSAPGPSWRSAAS